MIHPIKIKYRPIIWIIIMALMTANGISAVAAGYSFLAGQSERIPDLITYATFNNFFVPGIILFLIIALTTLFIAVICLLKRVFYPFIISLQGLALFIWTLAQMAFIGFGHPMLIMIGVVSIILIPVGFLLKDFKL